MDSELRSPTVTVTVDAIRVPKVEIVITEPSGATKNAVLALAPIVLGTQGDIVTSDPKVSRRHCSITLTERGVVVEDLGSKNGTFLSGIRIERAVVPEDTAFFIGDTHVLVTAESASEEIPLSRTPRFGDAIGGSVAMRALFAKLERIATTSETVLLIGESGTGKELLARAIHDASERRDAPFVIFDCGAVAPALVESELFGHVRGAFTGAQSDRRGVFSEAGSGTLVLDEIGELPLDLQPKLLRALESRQFRALGSNRVETVGARVVGGTHRDLKQMVQANTFRADLYFRLAVFEARVPPLRERRDDIELLADRLLTTLTPPRTLRELGTGVAAMLLAHDWPGNVRELRNTLMRLALFPELGARAFENVAQGPSGLDTLMHLPLRDAREEAITQFERHYLRAKLAENDGNVAQTAEAIGVSRQLVYRLIERHGLG